MVCKVNVVEGIFLLIYLLLFMPLYTTLILHIIFPLKWHMVLLWKIFFNWILCTVIFHRRSLYFFLLAVFTSHTSQHLHPLYNLWAVVRSYNSCDGFLDSRYVVCLFFLNKLQLNWLFPVIICQLWSYSLQNAHDFMCSRLHYNGIIVIIRSVLV